MRVYVYTKTATAFNCMFWFDQRGAFNQNPNGDSLKSINNEIWNSMHYDAYVFPSISLVLTFVKNIRWDIVLMRLFHGSFWSFRIVLGDQIIAGMKTPNWCVQRIGRRRMVVQKSQSISSPQWKSNEICICVVWKSFRVSMLIHSNEYTQLHVLLSLCSFARMSQISSMALH